MFLRVHPWLKWIGVSALLLSAPLAQAGEKSLIDTTRSPSAKMYMPDLADVRWRGGLLGERFEVCRTTMIPHMWTIFSDKNESHAWDNFLMAAGLGTGRDGKPHGPSFNDGDLLKWVEALSQIYALTRDPAIDKQLDEIIAVVAKAQRADGYLHTPKIILQNQARAAAATQVAQASRLPSEPTRQDAGTTSNAAAKEIPPGTTAPKNAAEFEDREHFETYNMGHLMTTACIHYRATGKTTLLACARKAADYIDHLCATVPADLARNAICPSHYMGVVELYRVTREPRYLTLAKQLIEIRSLVPPDVGSDQNQDRVPFREMFEAVGHAVRANYLYAGAADVFAEDGDATLLKPLTALSENVADKKLYVTGMTGALYDGASPDGSSRNPVIKTVAQSYGRPYQLPNLSAYNETCATIGYAMWQWRMLEVTGDSRYADLFEQSLYNGVLPGISLEGKHYFYVNALKKLKAFDSVPLRWSRTRTPNIRSSFCCPPNVVRTIAEAHNYVYSLSPDTLWVHLYAASDLDTAWTDGARIKLRQETDYPWSGAVKLTIDSAPAKETTLKLRIPGWLKPGAAKILVNGQPVSGTGVPPVISEPGKSAPAPPAPTPASASVSQLSALNSQPSVPQPGSYFSLCRAWKPNDTVSIDFAFTPILLEANPLVEETTDQLAVRCGPLVYCVESNDLPEGVKLTDVALALDDAHRTFTAQREKIADASVVTLTVPAFARQRAAWSSKQLYREAAPPVAKEFPLKLVPYYAWGNRGDTEMSVWLPSR